jgi:Holliday junction resolvasome RuvABC endonuclease subunit
MLDQIGTVEATTNRDLADRITQVKQIVDEVVTAINQNVANLQQIISAAEQKIVGLENQIYLDAQSLLSKLQCVAQNMATVQIQELIANAVAELRAADPGVTFLGIRIINLSLKQIQITDPDQAYTSVRDAYLKRMNLLSSTDPAYAIVSTYANIERLAEEASCAYRDPTVAAAFLREEFNYRRLAGAWAVVPFAMIGGTP